MAQSAVQICNMALGRIGISREIAALTEASNEAVQCKRFYEATRDRVLQEAPWRFATRRQALADVGTPPDGWLYRYRYPNDCLHARGIVNTALRTPAADQRIAFAIFEDEDNSALAIATDEASAILEYTRHITDPNLFAADFTSTLAWALAVEIGMPLKADPKLRADALKFYQYEVGIACARSFNEGREDQPPDSEFIRARG